MNYKVLLFFLTLIEPQLMTSAQNYKSLIVWNIGQGQFISLSGNKVCEHFDAGGEWLPKTKLFLHCSWHRFQLTHTDQDHINLIKKIPNKCLTLESSKLWTSRYNRKRHLKNLDICATNAPHVLTHSLLRTRHKTNDDKGYVYKTQNFLIPGDASKRTLSHWSPLLKDKKKLNLIAPHHGSKNSYSKGVFHSKNIKSVIVSARRKRYGHPHPIMEDGFKSSGIPVLKTEDWGHLIFAL